MYKGFILYVFSIVFVVFGVFSALWASENTENNIEKLLSESSVKKLEVEQEFKEEFLEKVCQSLGGNWKKYIVETDGETVQKGRCEFDYREWFKRLVKEKCESICQPGNKCARWNEAERVCELPYPYDLASEKGKRALCVQELRGRWVDGRCKLCY